MIILDYNKQKINNVDVNLISIPSVSKILNELFLNKEFINMIKKDNITVITLSPFYILWDYFFFEYENDEMKFIDYFNLWFNKIIYNIENFNNVFVLDASKFFCSTIFIKSLDYKNMSLEEIDNFKLLDTPSFNLFYDDNMQNKIKMFYQKNLSLYNPHITVNILPNDFNLKEYAFLNTSIKNKHKLLDNFIKKKDKYKIENIPKNFNIEIFKIICDKKFKNDTDLLLYYENEGYLDYPKYKFENIPKNFNYFAFKLYNKKLRKLSKKNAYEYMNTEGWKLNIKCTFDNIPFDFDPIKYKDKNKDLSRLNLNKYELYCHYEIHGFYQGRKYK